MTDKALRICVLIGILVILFGACFITIERPISIPDTKRARIVAYVSFATGTVIAVVIPAAMMVIQHFRRK